MLLDYKWISSNKINEANVITKNNTTELSHFVFRLELFDTFRLFKTQKTTTDFQPLIKHILFMHDSSEI